MDTPLSPKTPDPVYARPIERRQHHSIVSKPTIKPHIHQPLHFMTKDFGHDRGFFGHRQIAGAGRDNNDLAARLGGLT